MLTLRMIRVTMRIYNYWWRWWCWWWWSTHTLMNANFNGLLLNLLNVLELWRWSWKTSPAQRSNVKCICYFMKTWVWTVKNVGNIDYVGSCIPESLAPYKLRTPTRKFISLLIVGRFKLFSFHTDKHANKKQNQAM